VKAAILGWERKAATPQPAIAQIWTGLHISKQCRGRPVACGGISSQVSPLPGLTIDSPTVQETQSQSIEGAVATVAAIERLVSPSRTANTLRAEIHVPFTRSEIYRARMILTPDSSGFPIVPHRCRNKRQRHGSPHGQGRQVNYGGARELGTARPFRQGCHELDESSEMPSEQCAEESVRSRSTVLPKEHRRDLSLTHARPMCFVHGWC
jgi:hypothetical protein